MQVDDPAVDESGAAGGQEKTADRPIETLDDDRMGRRRFAEELAREILSAPADEGYVLALTGAWGSGKTSILNMTAEAVGDDAIVIQFNPWMFSGTEALVSVFFQEVSKELGRKRATAKVIAEKLATYGRLLSPVAAVLGAGGAVEAAADLLQRSASDPSVFEERAELKKELSKLDSRLVVVLDDVDRLRPDEVRDIIRLVRLVGDFPNTIYLLAFDRRRVEECLGEGDLQRGRAYLEKIVQVAYDVPIARDPDLTTLFLDGLLPLVGASTTGPLRGDDWQNVFAFVIKPLLESPRDVRRYLQSLPMTIQMVGDEVALADLLALESIRVLRPDMFEAIVNAAAVLGTTRSIGVGGSATGDGPTAGALAGLATLDVELASSICRWLFPAAGPHFGHTGYGPEWIATWRKQRKVANPDVFRYYLERRLPDGVVPAHTIDDLLESLRQPARLHEILDSLDSHELADALERLAQGLADIPYDPDTPLTDDPASISLPILLDQLPRLPKGASDANPFGPGVTIGRLALRMVERFPDPDIRIATVRDALSRSAIVSSRIIMLRVLGHRPNIGLGIIPATVADELEAGQRELIAGATPDDLATDPSSLTIANLLGETTEGKTALGAAAENDTLMIALLVDATGRTSGRALGAAATDFTTVLSWDHLVGLLGEELLVRRIAELLTQIDDGNLSIEADQADVLDLAARYATGWRPDPLMQMLMNATYSAPSAPTAGTKDDAPPDQQGDG
ncbi:MAG: KAP family P-loop NTPase fold protein [Acidimicrobiales bacterium]